MEGNFWQQAWQEGRIGFHRDKPHQHLIKFHSSIKDHTKVFVPLAGKTLDMLYLKDQGHHVVAVELSSLAIDSFFKDNQLTPKVTRGPKHTKYSVPGLELYHGDFFDLPADIFKNVGAVYDRAALIALPAQMRERYAQFMLKSLPDLKDILLIGLEYDQSKAPGPPFSVGREEVEKLYGEAFKINTLIREEVELLNPKFKDKGIKEFWQTGYHLKRS